MTSDGVNYLLGPVDTDSLTTEERLKTTELLEAWITYSLQPDIEIDEFNPQTQPGAEYLNFIRNIVALHKESDAHALEAFHRTELSEEYQSQQKAVLLSGSYRTMANSYLLQKQESKARSYFKLAASVLRCTDAEIIGKTIFFARSRLGLLDEACSDIEQNFLNVLNGIELSEDVISKLTVLHSEVELIRHELTIAQQKQQLFMLPQNNDGGYDLADTSAFKKALQSRSPSQLGQDIWALEQNNYKRDGFFVEFGATDGVLLSNSYILEKYFGWRGICAEPNPNYFAKLKINRRCIVSEKCIAAKTGDQVEFIFADEYGGIASYSQEDSHAQKRAAYEQQNGKAILETISLHDFLLMHNAPRVIDYLSIDTEGSEYDILNALPFNEWDIKCITVEHNFVKTRDDIFNLLTSKGYKRQTAEFDDWYYKD